MTGEDYPRSHSAGGVVVGPGGEVAVVNQEGGTWSLPKGHLAGDEQPLDAARREIGEETGLSELSLLGELGSYARLAQRDGVTERKTITMFLFTTRQTRLLPKDPANPEARWVPLDRVAELLSNDADKAFFATVLHRVRKETMRPRVLIGSSSEALPVAEALQAGLDGLAECTVWNQGTFRLSRTGIENLVEAVAATDFAVFVLHPDDVTELRGSAVPTTRDNVVFELGLAIGALGRERTFMVMPAGTDLHLPTDLLGVVAATYRADRQDGNLRAALGPAVLELRTAIQRP